MSRSQLVRYLREQRRQLESMESGIQLAFWAVYEDTIAHIEAEIEHLVRRGRIIDASRLNYLTRLLDGYLQEWQLAARGYMVGVADRRARDLARRDLDEIWRVMTGSEPALGPVPAAAIRGGFVPRFSGVAFENVTMMFRAESPLQQSLANYSAELREAIRQEVMDGIAQGRGGRDVLMRIHDRATGDFARSRVESLVRTEMMRGYRAQNDADFDALGIELGGWVWSASKSRRTCLACLRMDGTFVATGEERRDRFHIRCRCRWLPVPSEGMDAFMAEWEDGETWLRQQGDATLKKMMPNAEARAAFQRGDLHLGDFTSEHRHPVWGASVYQNSGRRALERMARRR